MNLELWNLYTVRPARIPASMGDWLLRTVALAAEILAIEGCLSRVSLLWTFDAGELPRSKRMNPQPCTHEQHSWIL
ncbi:rCG57415 [Rattus norvegicus]|uniref:RCG57415 n=1 Tax=Rattus norvegicus TaxID=10116 RepID=A6JPA0_RAT|nr:rCG57415 [Rattus norvegicus]